MTSTVTRFQSTCTLLYTILLSFRWNLLYGYMVSWRFLHAVVFWRRMFVLPCFSCIQQSNSSHHYDHFQLTRLLSGYEVQDLFVDLCLFLDVISHGSLLFQREYAIWNSTQKAITCSTQNVMQLLWQWVRCVMLRNKHYRCALRASEFIYGFKMPVTHCAGLWRIHHRWNFNTIFKQNNNFVLSRK